MSEDRLNIVKDLNPHYFWDTDIEKLDVNHSRRLIVERVFSLGTLEEIKLIIYYYKRQKVVEVLTNLNYLDPKSLNFAALLFNLPLNFFKCYKSKRSNLPYWNS